VRRESAAGIINRKVEGANSKEFNHLCNSYDKTVNIAHLGRLSIC